jgi:hypothetical protein
MKRRENVLGIWWWGVPAPEPQFLSECTNTTVYNI